AADGAGPRPGDSTDAKWLQTRGSWGRARGQRRRWSRSSTLVQVWWAFARLAGRSRAGPGRQAHAHTRLERSSRVVRARLIICFVIKAPCAYYFLLLHFSCYASL